MTITLDPEIARDLIETKLRVLTEKIDEILGKWNLNSIEELSKQKVFFLTELTKLGCGLY